MPQDSSNSSDPPVSDANTPDYIFTVKTGGSSFENFEVIHFEGEEELSRLFEFTLDLYSTDGELDFSEIVNQSATLLMARRGESIPITGIVQRFEQVGQRQVADGDDKYHYRAVLAPHLWRLSLNYRSRIFQNQSVEDIIRTILDENDLADVEYRFDFSGNYEYPKRDYCVQYRETDLAFISRLMEHEGICYYFEQDALDFAGFEPEPWTDIWTFLEQMVEHMYDDLYTEKLVMTDKAGAAHPEISSPEAELSCRDVGGMQTGADETVWDFACRQRVVTGEVMMKDYNYEDPETPLESTSALDDGMKDTEHYEYGEHFGDVNRGNHLAKRRKEAIACQREVMHGGSDCTGLRAGHRFTLADHYRDDRNQDYLLTRIEHTGSQAAAIDIIDTRGEDDPDGAFYRNTFTCIPAGVQFRPERRTPKPEVPGVMTARVDGGGGDYAYLDDQGRYRAKMHFDRRSGDDDGTTSKPIRMNQPHSGKKEAGFHTHNRPGTEMVFACVNGDPDRPMALGTAPNNSNPSPVTSENNSQHALRTPADNELLFEDKKDSEHIELFTPFGNSVIHMGKPGRLVQGIGMTTEKTAEMHAQNGLVFKAGGAFKPDASEFEESVNNMQFVLDAVSSAAGKTINKADLKSLHDGLSEAVDGWEEGLGKPALYVSAKEGIGVNTPGGLTLFSGGGTGVYTDKGIDVVSKEALRIAAEEGGASIFVKKGGVNLRTLKGDVLGRTEKGGVKLVAGNVSNPESVDKGEVKAEAEKNLTGVSKEGDVELTAESENVSLDGKKKITIEAGDEIALKCGQASITLKKNGDITLNGMNITSKAKKNITSQAKMKNVTKGMNVTSQAKTKSVTKGMSVTSQAQAQSDIKSSGITSVKGGLVKVG